MKDMGAPTYFPFAVPEGGVRKIWVTYGEAKK